jgi:hypothetical protein
MTTEEFVIEISKEYKEKLKTLSAEELSKERKVLQKCLVEINKVLRTK